MKLEEGLRLSTEVIKALYPYCRKVAVAGSIRRQKPEVKDIDIVLIPKPTLGAWNQAILQLQRHLRAKVLKQGQKYCQLQIGGVNVDLYNATEENWGSILLQRTGPWQFNEKLAKRAKRMGMRWTAQGIIKDSKVVAGKTEEEIFQALEMEYITPEDRDE